MAENDDEVTTVSTDQGILNDIGEGNEPGTGEGTEGEGTRTAADPKETPLATDGEQGAKGGDAKKLLGQTGGPEDLLGKDGKVIAASGRERRFYESAIRADGRATKAETEVTTLKAQIEAINNAGTVGKQYNLTPEEVVTGAQIVSSYKKDPVATLQYLLTQAQGNGIDISTLTQGGGGVDLGAVKDLLDKSLAPLISDRQERIKTEEATAKAQELHNDLLRLHPDAAVHDLALARLLTNEPTMSPETAYYKLQNFYLQKGLDWTKPLEVIYKEADDGKTSSVVTRTQPPEGGGVNEGDVTDKAQVADVSTSTRDIVKSAMVDAGYNFNE